jgi:hypothetical protein
MGKIFRVGDLVMINKSYNPSQNYYCKIINIIDEFGKSHTSYDVITGYGDKNSKVKIDLLTLGIETDYVTVSPMYVCMYVCMYHLCITCMYVSPMYVCMYVCMYHLCMYVCITYVCMYHQWY